MIHHHFFQRNLSARVRCTYRHDLRRQGVNEMTYRSYRPTTEWNYLTTTPDCKTYPSVGIYQNLLTMTKMLCMPLWLRNASRESISEHCQTTLPSFRLNLWSIPRVSFHWAFFTNFQAGHWVTQTFYFEVITRKSRNWRRSCTRAGDIGKRENFLMLESTGALVCLGPLLIYWVRSRVWLAAA